MVYKRKKLSFIERFLLKVPGKVRFGPYRLLPLFFAFGACIELTMIYWQVGEVNFCKFITMLFETSGIVTHSLYRFRQGL